MMRRFPVVVMVFVLGLAGCATERKAFGQQNSIPKAETPAVLMFLNNCPVEPVGEPVAIPVVVAGLLSAAVTTLGPVAFELIAGSVSDALERRAAELSASTTATTRTELWKETESSGSTANKTLRPWPRCLVFVRGAFGRGETSVPGHSAMGDLSLWDAKMTERVNQQLERADDHFKQLKLQGVPEFYLELPIFYPHISVPKQGLKDAEGTIVRELKDDFKAPTAIELGPPVVYYFKPGPKRSKTTKRLVFTLTVSADVIKDGKREPIVLVDRPIDLGEMSWPAKADREKFISTSPLRMSLPYPFEERITLLFEGSTALYASALNRVAISATGVLTESEDGGDIERAIAKAARENHKKVSDPVVEFLEGLIKKASEKEEGSK